MATGPSHYDVIIVGAGLSGIDAAYRLQTDCPHKSYAILEARGAIGGTWDLFRYPGIRSDSDMYTLGFPFRPWTGDKAIAHGEAIRTYVEDTAREFGIDRRIRFNTRVFRASWSTDNAIWTLDVEEGGRRTTSTCRFLYMGSGYYDYAAGFTPEWPDIDAFQGKVIHPQHWPADLDTAGKRIVVIGSGATAVTLVPALAETAAHVTMLQRSPTYIVSRPSQDGFAQAAQKALPPSLAGRATRWKSILLGIATYSFARRRPATVKAAILRNVAAQLPEGYEIARDFEPRYAPWDQRICLVPDADLFRALKSGRAEIVTDTIARFTPTGLALASGRELAADIVVTATGLVLKLFGGVELVVDGRVVDPAERMAYKGMMLSDVPNLVLAFGYTNASWTLKCDLTARYACRLINHMDREGVTICTPRRDWAVAREPMLGFTSGYVTRATAILPQQGATAPWRVHQNYLRDLAALSVSPLDDGVMAFTRPGEAVADAAPAERFHPAVAFAIGAGVIGGLALLFRGRPKG
jgi:cation diffusion facilitator CzcD-associated flavoprotein CzcO